MNLAKPTQSDYTALLRLARYLLANVKRGTWLLRGGKLDAIEVITDSDWARCKKTRGNTAGIVVEVAGCVQGHACRTQKTVAQSSAEAEFYATASGVSEGIYLQKIYAHFAAPMNANLNVDSTWGDGHDVASRSWSSATSGLQGDLATGFGG